MPRIQAAQRLKLHKQLMANSELPRFRYIDDADRFIENLGKDINELKQVVRIQHVQLAKVKEPRPTFAAYLTKASGLTKRKQVNAAPIKFTRSEVPDLGKLESQYFLAKDLYARIKLLQKVHAQVLMQFPDKGKALETTVSRLLVLKDELTSLLRETLEFLQSVARAHVPKQFGQYVQAVTGEIEKCVKFDRCEHFLYVNVTSSGQIVFTGYIMLIGAVNSIGDVTPHLYISLQWVVGQNTVIALNHEFETPEDLFSVEGGTAVTSLSEAVQAIARQLGEEGFHVEFDSTPILAPLKPRQAPVDLNLFLARTR